MKDYKRIIAMSERSQGNETTGVAWIKTKSFDRDTPIMEVVKWHKSSGVALGKLIIEIDEDSFEEK